MESKLDTSKSKSVQSPGLQSKLDGYRMLARSSLIVKLLEKERQLEELEQKNKMLSAAIEDGEKVLAQATQVVKDLQIYKKISYTGDLLFFLGGVSMGIGLMLLERYLLGQ